MASSLTAYGPSGVTTTASVPGGYSNPNQPLLEELIRKRLQGAIDGPKHEPAAGRSMQPGIRRSGSMRRSGSNEAASERIPSALDQARARAEMAELEAISGKAPTRMTTFASGATNGLTLDPMSMTGAQRARFLPQGSSIGDPGTPTGGGSFEDFVKMSEVRRRIQEASGNYAGRA